METRTPSKEASMLILILCIIFAAGVILVPNLYAESHGIDTTTNNLVPKVGTIEYDIWCERFAEQHGREYDINDSLVATRNGMRVAMGYFGICFGFLLLCYAIWDIGYWAMERRAYLNREAKVPPVSGKVQAIRTGTYIIFVVLFSSLYFFAPYLMTPIT